MSEKRQYYGLDLLKFAMAILVAARHMIQVFYPADSRWRVLIGSWLSNLAVPAFFVIAGFLLFRKVPADDRRGKPVFRYCLRILKLYVLWCVLYWPIDLYNWYHGETGIRESLIFYLRSFLFSSTIAQLWYLPALIVASLIVWLCYNRGMKVWQILIFTGILFVAGCLGDNWYFNEKLPMSLQQLLYRYIEHFVTLRNGVFYGSFYVGLGLLFARKKWNLPVLVSAAGALAFAYLMYKEVSRCSITNMAFTAAPTAFFLVEGAMKLPFQGWKHFPGRFCVRLRGMSEWIYLSHFYFFYLFSWTVGWYSHIIPMTERNIALVIFVPMVGFAWWMVRLAEKPGNGWLKKLI